jgi:hypothetical protein
VSGIVLRDPCQPITAEMTAALEAAYPSVQRLRAAFALARDVEACVDLLAGRPVDPVRLDPVELVRAREATLVLLVSPLENLGAQCASNPKEATG